ncbi:MAG: acetolactate decarboxylase [Actinomycetes bacterium]
MWHRVSVTALVAAAVVSIGAPIASAAADDPWVHQIGTYDYLISPNYAGLAPITSASKGTTLGLGTFDHLDGELIMVGGESYRVGTDGTPVIIDGSQTTPFFESVKFAPTASGPVPLGTTCANLIAGVNALAQSDRGIVAVRVRGTFSDLTFRSVPAQTVPYPPLSQVVAKQTLFPLGERRAALVGFRTGPDLAGTGAPGLHLHGLTADRKAGGHVISCVAGGDVQLSVQRTAGVMIAGAQP